MPSERRIAKLEQTLAAITINGNPIKGFKGRVAAIQLELKQLKAGLPTSYGNGTSDKTARIKAKLESELLKAVSHAIPAPASPILGP